MQQTPSTSRFARDRQIDRIISGQGGLLQLFEAEIRAEHIAEELQSCSDHDGALAARRRMAKKGYDVLGVKDGDNRISPGRTYGYVAREELAKGRCGEYAHVFQPTDLVAASTPLLGVLEVLQEQPRIFVLRNRSVDSIITRADLQKVPVRLLLFGLISVFEMAMLQAIRREYPNDSWRQRLSPGRLANARQLLEERAKRNEAIDLADCLQFADKARLLSVSVDLRKLLGFRSKTKLDGTLVKIENLRNRLAHSQDVVAGASWPEVIEKVRQLNEFTERLRSSASDRV